MIDFKISDDGLMIHDMEYHCLELTSKDDLIFQIAKVRLKTSVGDWFNTTIGSNLENFLGRKNENETIYDFISTITDSLISDGFLKTSEIFIIPSMVKTNLSANVFIKGRYKDEPSVIAVTVELENGVSVN